MIRIAAVSGGCSDFPEMKSPDNLLSQRFPDI